MSLYYDGMMSGAQYLLLLCLCRLICDYIDGLVLPDHILAYIQLKLSYIGLKEALRASSNLLRTLNNQLHQRINQSYVD
jgi:hypothetical protein